MKTINRHTAQTFNTWQRPLAVAVLAACSLGAALPAFADAENDALKREVAEQKVLIQKIFAELQSLRAAQAAAPAAAPVAAPATSVGAKVASLVPGAPQLSFYGALDGGYEHISNVQQGSNKGSLNRLPNVTGTIASRVGVKAVKELTEGYKAIGVAEAGFNMDDGTLGQGGRLFGRQLYAGIDTPVGTFTFGRQYSMLLFGMDSSDLLGPNIYGLGSFDYYLPSARFDNSIAWRGTFSKLSMGINYSAGRDTKGGTPSSGTCAGEIAGNANSCKGWSAMIRYDDERFGLAAATDVQHGGTGATASFFNGTAAIPFTSSGDTDTRTALGGYVKLGQGKIGVGWLGRKVDAAAAQVKSDIYYVEGAHPITTRISVDGSFQRILNKDQGRDGSLIVLRGFYSFDKDFATYLQLAHIDNSSNAQYAASVGAGISPPAGGSQNASMIGLRYRF